MRWRRPRRPNAGFAAPSSEPAGGGLLLAELPGEKLVASLRISPARCPSPSSLLLPAALPDERVAADTELVRRASAFGPISATSCPCTIAGTSPRRRPPHLRRAATPARTEQPASSPTRHVPILGPGGDPPRRRPPHLRRAATPARPEEPASSPTLGRFSPMSRSEEIGWSRRCLPPRQSSCGGGAP